MPEMSILGTNNSGNMSSPFFHEFKKQASFFLKEKIKTARLALTDVTPSELLTEEATNGNTGVPDTRTLKIISKAAFEVDDYWRIVEILHKRFVRFDRKNWRPSYRAMIVLEHLLTHGPESVAEEFQSDKDVIREMETFQHIDEKGFNWGRSVRKKSERVMKLLEKGPILKEERDRARKLTRGIEGFGSFSHRSASDSEQKVLQQFSPKGYGRSNSQFNDHGNQEYHFSYSDDENLPQIKDTGSQQNNGEKVKKMENLNSQENVDSNPSHSHTSFKENMAPSKEVHSKEDLHKWTFAEESKSLLDGEEDDSCDGAPFSVEGDHPFNDENLTSVSLLSTTDTLLQAC